MKSTYKLSDKSESSPYIHCQICDMKSFNTGDIENKYCAKCDRFHETGNKRNKPEQTS